MYLENEYLLNNLVLQSSLSKVDFWGWGGGDSAYERVKGVGMLDWNFEIKPLKETNWGVAQAFLDP